MGKVPLKVWVGVVGFWAVGLMAALAQPSTEGGFWPVQYTPQPVFRGEEPRTALVISNAAYAGGARLDNPHSDAKGMAAALQRLGFEVIQVADRNLQQLGEDISGFADRLRSRGGVGLVYYSGHGVEVDGQSYLIPLGAQIRRRVDVQYRAYSVQQLLGNLAWAQNDLNLVILDACRNDPFGADYRDLLKTRGITPVDAPSGLLVASSTARGDLALDGGRDYGGYSPYTYHLLQQIERPNLLVEQVFREVRNRVLQDTQGAQAPWESNKLVGDFYFASAVGSPPPSPPPSFSFEPEMVLIRGGRFLMGSPAGEAGRRGDERQHEVRVGDFYLGKYEVTVDQFRQFVTATGYRTEAEGNIGAEGCWSEQSDGGYGYVAGRSWRDPGFPQTDDHPVVCVSWNDAQAYIDWLNDEMSEAGKRYRLPTEAEWEYTARGGTTSPRYWGNDPAAGCRYANTHDERSKRENGFSWEHAACDDGYAKTAPVGRFGANLYGLHDMLGNVWEWTCSEYDGDYDGSEQICAETTQGVSFALRGGSWKGLPANVRAANRLRLAPSSRLIWLGFRLARSL